MSKWWNPFTWWSKDAPLGEDQTDESQSTRTGRRIEKVAELAETIIAPWKKAVAGRDRIIGILKGQREGLKARLDQYVEALKERDEIIRDLVEERDDLTAKLEAIENGEKPADSPEVPEPEALPPPPGTASSD